MPRNRWQVPGTQWVQILRGPRPPSVKWPKAGQQQQRQIGGPSSHPPKAQNVPIARARVSVPPQEMRAVATERMSRIKASMAVLGEEDTEELQVLQVAFEKAEGLSKIPPVEHQIKGTEEFIGRAKKRLVQHDAAIQNAQESLRKAESLKEEVKRLSEAEEALQRLMVQTPVVPSPPPRSVEALQRMVEQLQIERDALAGQVKHQNSTRMMEKMHPVQVSEDCPNCFGKKTLYETPSSWGRHPHRSKQLELRDALEMGEIGIIKELTQLLAKGAVRLEGFPSMVSNMVV